MWEKVAKTGWRGQAQQEASSGRARAAPARPEEAARRPDAREEDRPHAPETGSRCNIYTLASSRRSVPATVINNYARCPSSISRCGSLSSELGVMPRAGSGGCVAKASGRQSAQRRCAATDQFCQSLQCPSCSGRTAFGRLQIAKPRH
jgi:hypothetical protein